MLDVAFMGLHVAQMSSPADMRACFDMVTRVNAEIMGLDHLGLAHHITFVTGYDSGHGVKPGPGMALAFAEAIGLKPSEIAVVGDNSHDIDMGRSAGAGLVIGVLSGTGDAATLEPIADACLPDFGDLPVFLTSHNVS